MLEIEFVFNVFGDPREGTMDCADLGDALRALNFNPSLDDLEKLGYTKKRGKGASSNDINNQFCFHSDEKKLKYDELLPIYSQLKKTIKDQGCYEDFIECLKLYDKDENGKMQVGELQHSLTALGTSSSTLSG